jgi:hypothetical protein
MSATKAFALFSSWPPGVAAIGKTLRTSLMPPILAGARLNEVHGARRREAFEVRESGHVLSRGVTVTNAATIDLTNGGLAATNSLTIVGNYEASPEYPLGARRRWRAVRPDPA